MVSPRIMSFFAFVYGGMVLTVIIGRAALMAFGPLGSLVATVLGAIITTAAVYVTDRRYAARQQEGTKYKDIQSKWRDELFNS